MMMARGRRRLLGIPALNVASTVLPGSLYEARIVLSGDFRHALCQRGVWSSAPDRVPNICRRSRHIDVRYPKRTQRIEKSIDDRRWRCDRPGLADAFDAKRICCARDFDEFCHEIRQVSGTRHGAVHEAGGDDLAGIAVIYDLLQHCLPDALREAAMNLTLADQRIYHPPSVVHHRVSRDAGQSRLRINFDFADMATVGIIRGVRPIAAAGLKPKAELVGDAAGLEKRSSD